MPTENLPIAPLTPKQQRVYDFIVSYKADHDGCAPTTREIVAALGLSTTSSVAFHLDALERRGLIRREGFGKSRLLVVVGGKWNPPAGWA